MSKKTYQVKNAIDHDGKRFDAGEFIDLEDGHAEPLKTVNAIGEPQAASKPASVVPVGDDKAEAIKAAIATLDANNTDAWMGDGKPKTEAIGAITGWKVTAAERDAAWAALTATK
jgi:hypothetical protein